MSLGKPNPQGPTQLASLHESKPASGMARLVIVFETAELDVDHGIVKRIEFNEKRCNLTLKNDDAKSRSVNVKVWVLNKHLIEIWNNAEKWMLKSLQPGESHLVSWEFKPAVPDVVWNQKAREDEPAWVVIDAT